MIQANEWSSLTLSLISVIIVGLILWKVINDQRPKYTTFMETLSNKWCLMFLVYLDIQLTVLVGSWIAFTLN